MPKSTTGLTVDLTDPADPLVVKMAELLDLTIDRLQGDALFKKPSLKRGWKDAIPETRLVFVEASLRKRLRGRKLRQGDFGLKFEVKPISTGGHQVDGIIFRAETQAAAIAGARRLCRELGIPLKDLRTAKCSADDWFLPLFAAADDVGKVEFLPGHDDAILGEASRRKYLPAIKAYGRILEDLSRLYGGVDFVAWYGRIGNAVPPADDGRIHIHPNATPPGSQVYLWNQRRSVFRMHFRRDGELHGCVGPTKGRGKVIKDDDGQEVATVLGQNLYLHFPIFSTFNEVTSLRIFKEILAEAMPLLMAPPASLEDVGIRTMAAEIKSWVGKNREATEEKLRQMEAEIALTQAQLTRQLRNLHEYAALSRLYSSSKVLKDMIRRVPGDLRRIKRMPMVERSWVEDGALLVRTKFVEIPWEDKLYRIGSFTVRLDGAGGSASGATMPAIGRASCTRMPTRTAPTASATPPRRSPSSWPITGTRMPSI